MTLFTAFSLGSLLWLLSQSVVAQSYDFTGPVTAATYAAPSVTTNGSVTAVTALSTSAPLTGLALVDLPSCAINCFEAALLDDGCVSADIACQCSKATGLVAEIEPCIAQNCSAPNALAFGAAIIQICSNVTTSPANLTNIISSELATAAAPSTSAATSHYTSSGYAVLSTSTSGTSSPTPSPAGNGTTTLGNGTSSTPLVAVFTGGASAGSIGGYAGIPQAEFLLALAMMGYMASFS